MCKKAIISILIFILLFNIMPQRQVMAMTITDLNELENGITHRDDVSGERSTASVGTIATSDGNISLIGSILTFVFLPLPLLVQSLLTLAIMPQNATKIQLFTIEDMLFGRFELFDVDFMNVKNYSAVREPAYVASETNTLIKKNVASWFGAMRNFAIVALFAVLIAIGIFMATSSIASDRAKYKNMLIHWFVSFAILMVLPYIMSFAMNVSEAAVGVVRTVAESAVTETVNNPEVEQTKGLNFEKTLVFGKVDSDGKGFDGILTKILKAHGWEAFSLMVVYCVLAFYQVKFFFLYMKRMITVGFLIVISPLITITYSLDKAQDNQAQAFKTWIKEFLVNIFVQPLHALLFLIFMYSIYGIMERAPILAIIFLAALSRGEKLFRTIFKVERTTSLRHLGKK